MRIQEKPGIEIQLRDLIRKGFYKPKMVLVFQNYRFKTSQREVE